MRSSLHGQYLESTEDIDWRTPSVLAKAKGLVGYSSSEEEVVKVCFEFVPDEIKHSWDYPLNPVTCQAFEVLKYGSGYRYSKSHLLAVLLRSENIPVAMCYQRLTINNDRPLCCLHGVHALVLRRFGCYRMSR